MILPFGILFFFVPRIKGFNPDPTTNG